MNLDKYEQEISDAYDKGKLKPKNPGKTELIEAAATAGKTFRKDKKVTIRLYEHDLKGIKKKALELGIPYQTLISSMIHRYIEGDLVDGKRAS